MLVPAAGENSAVMTFARTVLHWGQGGLERLCFFVGSFSQFWSALRFFH